MRLLILGGIGEALTLTQLLAPSYTITYSIAGKGRVPNLTNITVRVGGFGGANGLTDYLKDHHIDQLIDATHPYAAQISRNAVQAARQASIPIWAYRRPAWQPRPGDRWYSTTNWNEIQATVHSFRRPFFTIGLEPLHHAMEIPSHQQWLVRCLAAETIPTAQLTVLCATGPFSLEQEQALLQTHQIDILVAKNSGGRAVEAKLAAARTLKIPVVMLERPPTPTADREFTEIDALAQALKTSRSPLNAAGDTTQHERRYTDKNPEIHPVESPDPLKSRQCG